jgi:hypothetical protein
LGYYGLVVIRGCALPVPDEPSTTGPSAFDQAALIGLEAEAVERQIRRLTHLLSELRRTERAWLVGGRAERGVVRVLVEMDDVGWRVLADRHWPGTRSANIDVIVVGPGGVFVVDVKSWSREVRVEHDRLWRGDVDVSDEVEKLLDQTAAIENVVVETGLPPTEVVPLLVLAGRQDLRIALDRVLLIGEHDLVPELARRGVRLPAELVDQLVAVLDRDCPPMPPPAHRSARHARTHTDVATPLMETRQLWQALEEAAALEPIESWMTWLHPLQARQVSRTYHGPARIRGGAGTGKTVLALHRAKYLAARGDRVLFTSYLKTLAPINRALFARLAPGQRDRVKFATVHAVASQWLRDHGVDLRINQSDADTCFARAWTSIRHDSVLAELTSSPGYWKEEISTVIKGRGLAGIEEYTQLARVGRRTPLLPIHRAAVWALYEKYQQLLGERGVGDVDDMLLLARDLARQAAATGADTGFDAVIVDEVQDLTCAGVQFLHALVGDRTNGLLLAGDGQQSVYPGGFTLAEAGVSVVGRSTVLSRNYRNGELILRYALAVVADDQFDDLESDPAMGLRNIEAGRPGGDVLEIVGDRDSQEQAMTAHMEDLHRDGDVRYGDMAVLVPTNAAAERWQRALIRHHVPAILLKDYAGVPCDAVKVGTFHRAKGLEFAWVFIPDRDRLPEPRRPAEPEDVYRERAERDRRLLFVALTRARDGLCLGVLDPST